jgi:hypothetical protein
VVALPQTIVEAYEYGRGRFPDAALTGLPATSV